MAESVLKEEFLGEEIIVPGFPSYDKGMAEACGAFVRTYYPITDGKSFRKKKIYSYGIKSIMLASKIAEGLNPDELREGYGIFSRGSLFLTKNFIVKEKSLAGTYEMEGSVQLPPLGGLTGGSAPLRGRLTEDNTSGYDEFYLSEKKRGEFLPGLLRIIEESGSLIQDGLGEYCRGEDTTMETLMDNIYGRDRVLVKHSNSTIRYLNSIGEDLAYMHTLCTYLEEDNLLGIHHLSDKEAAERIRESGMRLMNPIVEKLASLPLLFCGSVSTVILGMAISSKLPDRFEPYFLAALPFLAASEIGYGILGVMPHTDSDYRCFKAMEERVGQ